MHRTAGSGVLARPARGVSGMVLEWAPVEPPAAGDRLNSTPPPSEKP